MRQEESAGRVAVSDHETTARTVQAAHPSPVRTSKKTQWVGCSVNIIAGLHQEMTNRCVQLRFSISSGNVPVQGRFDCRGVLDPLAGLAEVQSACALPVTPAWRVGGQQADGAQQGQQGVMVAGALRHGWQRLTVVRATEASSGARSACLRVTTVALFQAEHCFSQCTCTQEQVSRRKTDKFSAQLGSG